MASFVLIPGAGGMAWYWHRVVPLLERANREALAVDLPGEDALAGLDAYTDAVVRAIGARTDVVLVAQSLGGFTAHVPIRVFAGADDRFFPLSFQSKVARARLDADVHVVRGAISSRFRTPTSSPSAFSRLSSRPESRPRRADEAHDHGPPRASRYGFRNFASSWRGERGGRRAGPRGARTCPTAVPGGMSVG